MVEIEEMYAHTCPRCGNKYDKETKDCLASCCEDCGLVYEDHGVDIILPHDQWAALSNNKPEIILCGVCIAKRIYNLGADVAYLTVGFPVHVKETSWLV